MAARGDFRLRVACDSAYHPRGVSPLVFLGVTRTEAVRKARLAGWRIRPIGKTSKHPKNAQISYLGAATCPACWQHERDARMESPNAI